MSTPERSSLAARSPGWWFVPAGIAAAIALLAAGLALPVMRVEKLVFWEDDYSIITGAASLWRDGHYALSCVLFGFSVALPIAKLGALLAMWFAPMDDARRARWLWWMDTIGRWSMLDVFVVAVTVVLMSSKSTLGAAPREGLYVFAAAVIVSMAVTRLVERRAKKLGPVAAA